jgi:dihydrofolate synthase/folylpolyglutamate synthase
MAYAEAIEMLNRMIPELVTAPGLPRRKFSLQEFRILLDALGNPEKKFPSVLIAGTNGKGSTAATLASILTASGLRAGLYTSPHLERVNERIRLSGADIADEDFGRIFFQVQQCAEGLKERSALPHLPSFFEILTAIAFVYFSEQKVDIAVLEVGLGGRLDATNTVDPLISVITDISLDHTEWLGSTIPEIAREKAGILRPDGVFVTLPQLAEANRAIGEVAIGLNAIGVSATPWMPAIGVDSSAEYDLEVLGEAVKIHSPLHGSHQHRNLALAITAAVELKERFGFPINAASVAAGIENTVWPGRLEEIQAGNQKWILDVAHNPAGAWALRSGLNAVLSEAEPKTLLFSCLRDKPLKEIAQILFPVFSRVILAPIQSPRATSMEALEAMAKNLGVDSIVAASIDEAVRVARQCGGAVVASGSVYLVGEVRKVLKKEGN